MNPMNRNLSRRNKAQQVARNTFFVRFRALSWPTIFAFCIAALLLIAQSPPPQGSLKTIRDARTGKPVDEAIADGTVYRFEANMPKVHFWQVPVPLDGVWLESADGKNLSWISSASGVRATSAAPCPAGAGGGAGDCPTNNPNSCGGQTPDPMTEGCCSNQIYVIAWEECCQGAPRTIGTGCCVDNMWYTNGASVATCSNCISGSVVLTRMALR